jgi:pimeloyl-ACP methyl ester carboxylesterase
MDAAVLIPGIMGTRLLLPATAPGVDPEEVWPPTPLETQTGYKRIDKLLNHRVVAGKIIDKVLCFSFYKTISDELTTLGYVREGKLKRLEEFPYDWRKDNFVSAEALAARLDELHADGAKRITLIGHSMGGLVARLLLESGKYDARPWFGNIGIFLALATPHLGAPLALARIFGLDSTLGISGADFARLAADTNYPSGYQLIPAPGEFAVWNLESPDVTALDVYDDATASRLGLDPNLVARAKALHTVLGQARRPAHVRYFYVAGSGHRTVTRVNVAAGASGPVDHSKSVVTHTPDSGDGTVPMYSALPVSGQRQIVVNEHATVFDGRPFRHLFFRLLGGDDGEVLELDTLEEAPTGPRVALSLDSPVQRFDRSMELTLGVFSSAKAGEPDHVDNVTGNIIIEQVSENLAIRPTRVREIAISYRGPSIDRLTMELPPIGTVGLYRLSFEGEPLAANIAPFAVSRV